MCGASIPSDLYAALEKRADSPERVQELGVVHATIQSLGLIQGGAPQEASLNAVRRLKIRPN
ncbi:MAG: hypothetical protein KTR25_00715 [Myxococcales bacterium]|nr:hypothetical protein [Myxococcales bacterium]